MASLTSLPLAGLEPATITNWFQEKAFNNETTLFETLLEGGNVLANV